MLDVSTPEVSTPARDAPVATERVRLSSLRVAGNTMEVAAAGELDLATAPKLDAALRRAQAKAEVVVLDLRGVEFMDCDGLHVLLAADHRARRAGGRLVVVRGSATVQRLFGLVGLGPRLELVDRPPPWTAAPAVPEDISA